MGNCCRRKTSSSTDRRKTVDVTGRFSYLDDATIKHGDDNGEYACIDDVVTKPQNAVCSAEDVRAFFAVEPNETYEDECEGPQNHVTSGIGTTLRTFRLDAGEPRDGVCKLSNGKTSKTTTVLVKLHAHHCATPVGYANEAFSSEDQSVSDDSEMNRGSITKTSFVTFSADPGIQKEAISIKNAASSRRGESQKCDPNKTSVVMFQHNDTTAGDQQQSVASSGSTSVEVNRCEQTSSNGTHVLLRHEQPNPVPTNSVEKPLRGNHENNERNVISRNSRSCTETNKDGFKVKTSSISPSIIGDDDDVAIVGLEHIGITYRGEIEDDAILDCDKDLYPMYDSEFASSDYAEADRDLNVIWTEIEMIEENLCCIRDSDINIGGDQSALYEAIIGNIRDLSKTRDALAEFIQLDESSEEETNSDGMKGYKDDKYDEEVTKLNTAAAKALLQNVLKNESDISLRELLEKHNRTQARLRARNQEQRNLAHNAIEARLRMRLGQTGQIIHACERVDAATDTGDTQSKGTANDDDDDLSYFDDDDDISSSDITQVEMKVGREAAVGFTNVSDVAIGNTDTQTTDYQQTTISIGHDTDTETNSTQTGLTSEDGDIIKRLLNGRNDEGSAAKLIKEHVQSMEALRDRRRDFTTDQGQKLQEKLRTQINKRREQTPPPRVSSTTVVADDEHSDTSVTPTAPSCDTQAGVGPTFNRFPPARTATLPEGKGFSDKALSSNEQGTGAQTTSLFEEICVHLSNANSRSCCEQKPDKPPEPPMPAADPTKKATRRRADGKPTFTSISSQVRWQERSDLQPPKIVHHILRSFPCRLLYPT